MDKGLPVGPSPSATSGRKVIIARDRRGALSDMGRSAGLSLAERFVGPSASGIVSLRVALCVLAAAVSPFLILAAQHWNMLPPAFSSDYAQYLLHAQALVEGRPYGDTGYIYTPLQSFIGPPVLPPGLPLTIAPIVAVAGTHGPLLRVVMILSGLAFFVAVWLYHARHQSMWAAVAAVAFTAASIEGRYATVTVLSDLGFCALIWWFIYVADKRPRWSRAQLAALIVIGLGAISYRVAGVVLVPAVILWVAANFRRTGFTPLLAPLTWAILGLVTLGGKVIAMVPFGWDHFWRRLVYQLSTRPRDYRTVIFDALLYPFPSNSLNDIYHFVASMALLAGAVLLLRRHGRSFAAAFAVAYVFMLILVPVSDGRYLWPLFPVIGAAFLHGTVWLVRVARRGIETMAAERGVALAVVAPIVIAGTVRLARIPDPPSLLGHADVQALFSQVRATARDDSLRLVFMNPRVMVLETGVRTMPLFRTDSTSKSIRVLENARITHIVIGDLGMLPHANEAMQRMVRESPARFQLVYENPSFRLYRFLAPPADVPQGTASGRQRAL